MTSAGGTHWKRRHFWKTATGPRQPKERKRRETNEKRLDKRWDMREALSMAMTRLISQGIAAPGQEEIRKIAEPLGQDDRPILPSTRRRKQGRKEKEAVDLDYPALCYIFRTATREGGADAYGLLYEHNKPLFADHRAMDAFGWFASLVAKADTSDRPLGALAYASLAASKSGTKGALRPSQHRNQTQETGGRDTGGIRPRKPERGSGEGTDRDRGPSWDRNGGTLKAGSGGKAAQGMASSVAPAHSMNPPCNIAYKPYREKRRIFWRTQHSGSRNQLEPSPGTKGRSGGVHSHGPPIIAAGIRSHSPDWRNAARNPGKTAEGT